MAKKQWQPLQAIPKESTPASGMQAAPALPAPGESAQQGPVNVQTPRPANRPAQRGPLGGLGAVMGNMGPLPLVVAVAAMNRGGGLSAMTTQGSTQTPAVDMKSLLGDIAGYLPGTSGASATKVSKVLGMMDELRSPASPMTTSAVSTMNPMERNMGLMGALGRNLPIAGANNLTMISQMMGMMNNFRGGGMQTQSMPNGGGPLGALGTLSNLGNMANMVNTMRTMGGAMNAMNAMGMGSAPAQQQSQPHGQQQSPPVLQGTVLPSQNDIKDTVNRLLNGMDDRQKSELMEKARQFLGQR